MTSINVEQDEKNKKFISHQLFGSLSTKTKYLLSDNASPEERASYVRKRIRGALIILCVFILYGILSVVFPLHRVISEPAPVLKSVGVVQTVQLHDADSFTMVIVFSTFTKPGLKNNHV